MQIPLDYYRILGLPIQATDEQLRHAHRDRTLQLPRREYSEAAINARRELIDEAYSVLSDAAQRQIYDSRFLTQSYGSQALDRETWMLQNDQSSATSIGNSAQTVATLGVDDEAQAPISSIDIDDAQLVGALLILLELGEYELVLRLGRPFLVGGNVGLNNGQYGDPDIVGSDIVLTVALACLELGREQWQQGLYESAAESLETGQELLLREGLFAGIRGDIQADLFKLRPYRVLELLALPDDRPTARYQGIQLLQEMLNERGGIDGAGNDQSGLSTDDFLRFVQQLRTYLTSEEQQKIFEAEAQRPSAVATYLAVYSLIARGFAYRLPDLLRQAKLSLGRLGNRQDVALERSICVLLLGQTEEATQALEQSQEYNALSFIKEHSKDSPDLLPGLCLYAERWLQNEVFPHFRDLSRVQASLKDFFADEHVQAYLEDLARQPEADHAWSDPVHDGWFAKQSNGAEHVYHNGRHYTYTQVNGAASSASHGNGRAGATATLDAPTDMRLTQSNGTTPPPMAERVSQGASSARLMPPDGSSSRRSQSRSWFNFWQRSPRQRASMASASRSVPETSGIPRTIARQGTRRRSKETGLRVDRIIFLAAIGLVGLLAFWMVLSRFLGWLGSSLAGPQLEGEQLEITLSEPFINIPDPAEVDLAASIPADAEATGELTPEVAVNVVERWLAAKVLAMGDSHDAEALNGVLTGDLLSYWQSRSTEDALSNRYWEYEHGSVNVTNVIWSEELPDQATIEADVQESGEYFVAGQISLDEAYDTVVNVRYELAREDDGWKIQSVQVLN